MMQKISIEEISRKIGDAKHLAVLSGAGVSTAAGIPDFRGPQGIYVTRQYDPEKTFDIRYFYHDPTHFYRFAWDFMRFRDSIYPSITHHVLAALENRGKLDGIVTQNIDRLHQQAGSENVVEFHGSYGSAFCSQCEFSEHRLNAAWWCERMAADEQHIARCSQCGGVLKPNIVFFGENVMGLYEAESLARQADLMLVLGSSLTVYPAAFLPQLAQGEIVIVNKGPVAWQGNLQTYFLDDDLDTVFGQIATEMEIFISEKK